MTSEDALEILLQASLKKHECILEVSNQGYVKPLKVCAMWQTKKYYDESGRETGYEEYGLLDTNIACTCGAEEHNHKMREAASLLDDRIQDCKTFSEF